MKIAILEEKNIKLKMKSKLLEENKKKMKNCFHCKEKFLLNENNDVFIIFL